RYWQEWPQTHTEGGTATCPPIQPAPSHLPIVAGVIARGLRIRGCPAWHPPPVCPHRPFVAPPRCHYTGPVMKIHEYQARQILGDAGIAIPPAEVVRTADEAAAAFRKFNSGLCVVKAQVYAGGRGKAGFVKLVKSEEEAREAARFMLSNRMVSYQTGPEGVPVNVLLVAPGVDIAKEFYLGMTIDRARNTVTLIASSEGGMEIEEVARKSPDKVLKVPLHPLLGLQAYQANELAYRLGFEGKMVREAARMMMNLARVFRETDA